MSARSFASAITQRLNFDPASPLRGQVHLHTNPNGHLSSNALQRVVMNSRNDGAIREMFPDTGEQGAFNLISDFYGAVADFFGGAWVGMSPKTSRLVHGVGIVAMGYVMDYCWIAEGARSRSAFAAILKRLEGRTAWTSGTWSFPGEQRPWSRIQNTSTDIRLLTDYLLATLKRTRRMLQVEVEEAAQ